ncbi:hypothetical protein ACFY97_03995 [Streptomyces klenkii]|uniref:hypothetical protein n=1 Tax=Streptomyces klenkii TaxID=1420899 RepID=UPI0036EBABB3
MPGQEGASDGSQEGSGGRADGSRVEVVEGGAQDALEPAVPVCGLRLFRLGALDGERGGESGQDGSRCLGARRGGAPLPGVQKLPGSPGLSGQGARQQWSGAGGCQVGFVSARHGTPSPVLVLHNNVCPGADADALAGALRQGSARAAVERHLAVAQSEVVQGSPHLFLPDGTSAFIPGVRWHWPGHPGRGFLVLEGDEPAVYEQLVRQAASA